MRVKSSTDGRMPIPVALLVLAAVAGCGSSESQSSATAVTTSTAATASTQIVTDAGVGSPPAGEPWDVLFLASRFELATADVVAQYELLAEESLGVDVRMQDSTGQPQTAWEILQQIRNLGFPGMAEEVAESEVIIVVAYPQGSDEGAPTQIDEARDRCRRPGQDTQPPDPGVVGTAEFWEPYRVLLDQIYTEIWRLREGTPTVLVAGDVYDGYLANQRSVGVEEECRAWFEAWSDAARETAEAHGAKWVSIYDLLNGPGHDIVPQEMGWTGPSEREPTLGSRNLNDIGSALVADALAGVGFVPADAP